LIFGGPEGPSYIPNVNEMKKTREMIVDIEILADRWEEEQAILKQLATEDWVTQGEVCTFNEVNDELPF